jgi:hypothetical protein
MGADQRQRQPGADYSTAQHRLTRAYRPARPSPRAGRSRVAELVAAKAQACRVIALDPQTRAPEISREALERFERCWQLRKPQTWELCEPGFKCCDATNIHASNIAC